MENELFDKNKKLAYMVAGRFHTTLIEKDDLQQLALIGLWKACETYEKSKGYKFSTYAVRCCKNEILKVLRKEKNMIHFTESDFIKENDDYEESEEVEEFFSIDEKIAECVEAKIVMDKATEYICRKNEELMPIFKDGYTVTELAKKLGTSRQRLNSKLLRTRAKLKTLLEKDLEI